jgi:hypothetical protein
MDVLLAHHRAMMACLDGARRVAGETGITGSILLASPEASGNTSRAAAIRIGFRCRNLRRAHLSQRSDLQVKIEDVVVCHPEASFL